MFSLQVMCSRALLDNNWLTNRPPSLYIPAQKRAFHAPRLILKKRRFPSTSPCVVAWPPPFLMNFRPSFTLTSYLIFYLSLRDAFFPSLPQYIFLKFPYSFSFKKLLLVLIYFLFEGLGKMIPAAWH